MRWKTVKRKYCEEKKNRKSQIEKTIFANRKTNFMKFI